MSGSSFDSQCPRCQREHKLMVYADWKPCDVISSVCLDCGFTVNTVFAKLTAEELKQEQEDYEYTPEPLTEEEKKQVARFDGQEGI